MILGISGSRDYDNYEEFKKYIEIYKPSNQILKIVSGGCKGTDKMAEKYANEKSIKFREYLPNKERYGDNCWRKRNEKIVKNCDYLLAFPLKKSQGLSRGTTMTINIAEKKKKLYKIIEVDKC